MPKALETVPTVPTASSDSDCKTGSMPYSRHRSRSGPNMAWESRPMISLSAYKSNSIGAAYWRHLETTIAPKIANLTKFGDYVYPPLLLITAKFGTFEQRSVHTSMPNFVRIGLFCRPIKQRKICQMYSSKKACQNTNRYYDKICIFAWRTATEPFGWLVESLSRDVHHYRMLNVPTCNMLGSIAPLDERGWTMFA